MDVGAQFLRFMLEALLCIFIRILFVFDGSKSNEIIKVLKFFYFETKLLIQTILSGSIF